MSNAELMAQRNELTDRLSSVDHQIRFLGLIKGAGIVTVAVGVCVGLGLLADFVWDFPIAVRSSLLGLSAVVAAFFTWRQLIRPAVRSARTEELAALLESRHPELQERLTSAVELSNPDAPDEYRGSLLMRELLLKQARESVRDVPVRDAEKPSNVGRWGFSGAAVLLGLLAPFLFFGGYGLLVARFFAPWENLERASNLYFVVDEGDRTIARGSDVEIAAAAEWRYFESSLPDEVWLRWKNDRGDRDRRQMAWNDERGRYVAMLPHVFHSFDFEVVSGSARTRAYHVNVVEAPALVALMLSVDPPAYTGRHAELIDGAVGEMVVLEGSRLSLSMAFNKPVVNAVFAWTPASTDEVPAPETIETQLDLAADGMSGALSLDAGAGGEFAILLTDRDGLSNPDEPIRRIRVIVDEPPLVAYADSEGETEARPNDVLRLPLTASDDLGVAALELHYEVLRTGGDDGRLPLTGVLETDAALLGGRSVETEFSLDLSELDLSDGGLVAIRGRAADERPVPGPNESWTEQRLIGISDAADPYGAAELAEQQRQVKEALGELRQAVLENQEQVDELHAEAEQNLQDNASFERDAEASRLEQDQRELVDRSEQLAAIFELHPLYANLGERTRAVAREPLTSAVEEMERAAGGELSEKEEGFQQASQNLAEAAERLERLEAEFEQLAALERDLLDLQQLADRTERLASDVEDFDAARSETRPEETAEQQQAREQRLATEQQQLQQDHQELTADLDDLLERRPELLDAALEDQLERLSELAERAGEIADREEALSEALQDEAAHNAEELAPLAERQQELIDQAEQLASDNGPEIQNPADPLNIDALRDALEELNAGNTDEAAERQQAAADALERLADELARNAELSGDPQQAARQLAERQSELNDEMRDSLTEPEAGRPEDAPEPTGADELAAAQAAIQAAAAQLQTPRSADPQREEAVEASREAVEALRQDEPGDEAVAAGERTEEALARLAEQFGSLEERHAEALEQVERLQQEQEQLAGQASEAAARQSEEPAESAERSEQLAAQQRQLAEELEGLDAPGAEAEQQRAAAQARAAEGDLNADQLQDAPASQQEARQALADLEQALRGEPSAAEAVAGLQEEQQQIARGAEGAGDERDSDALAEQAGAQEDVAEELARLQTPAAEEQRAAAESAAAEAAEALQSAANDAGQAEEAMQSVGAAQESLDRLAEALAPTAGENPQTANAAAEEGSPAGDQQGSASELADAAADLAEEQRNLASQTAEQSGQTGSDEGLAENDSTVPAAAQEQSELAREAAEMAVETARQTGAESTAAEQAREFAEQAAAAAEQAASGQLAAAAESAQQAGESAESSAESLANPPQGEGDAQPELSRQAEQLAERQRQAAENLTSAANSTEARRTAQQQGQRQLEQAAEQLTSEFQDVFEQLSSAPLSEQDRAQQASESQASSSEAQESMRAAANQQQRGDFQSAAEAAQSAAEALRQAAGQARTAAQQPADAEDSPVPGEAGSQVAQASRQLEAAGQQLNQPLEMSPEPTQSASTEEATTDDSASRGAPEGSPDDAQTAEADTGGMQPGEQQGDDASASQSLQDAADALQQAVARLQPSSPSNQRQQSSASSQSPSEMPSSSRSTPQDSERAGTGTQEGVSLVDLELQLKELSTRDWGELPGTLQTELQSSTRRRPQGDYARLIKLYFDEISRRQTPELDDEGN